MPLPPVRRLLAVLAAGPLVLAPLTVLAAPAAQAAPTDLFISEYVEGSANNKAVEIFNGTGAAVDLAAAGYALQYYFNGAATAGLSIPLTGTVPSGDVHVVAQASASAAVLAAADQTDASGWFNGDDAVVLAKAGSPIDVVGQIGVDPGAEWGTGLASTADNTLRRNPTVQGGDPDGADTFDPAAQWTGLATDTFDGLGSHAVDPTDPADAAPQVLTITPADGEPQAGLGADLTVAFSEPVTVTDPWFSLTCSASGDHAATVTGGPTGYTLDPVDGFVNGDVCTFTVLAAGVGDLDADDPPDTLPADVTSTFTAVDVCALPSTPAYDIQGSGPAAAVTGTVSTQGVVVGDYEGPSPTLRGFYLQDATGDGDPATSDAVFVFNGGADTVQLGDLVRVSGTAAEFQDQTQVSATSVTVCGTGTIAPTDVTLPFASPDDPERFEGMLVRFPQRLTVTEHFQLGRFGQVVVSSGGRLVQPTEVALPGAAANTLQAANDLNRVIIDDALQNQNPDPIVLGRGGQPLSAANTLRGGDTTTGATGVLTYTWAGNAASGNAFRLRPQNALGGGVRFDPSNPRPDAAPARTGTLRTGSMNLLNFFNTFDGASSSPPFACSQGVGGPLVDCRGADDAGEFARQWPKTVQAVLGTQADVLGLVEVENDGYGPDSALAFLVDRLNDATAPGTYAYVDVDAATGQVNALGTDAIKVGVIYKPAAAIPVETTAALNSVAFVNGGDADPRNRPALAQAFRQPDGQRFVLVVNHLKSKGSGCDVPDALDGQGGCNAVRTEAAGQLASWLATDPTGTGEQDVLVVGDLNAYGKEDPVRVLEGAGYADQVTRFHPDGSYSFAFDGQWGSLDHALASTGLAEQVTGAADWHINADEPSVLDYNDDFKSAGQLASLYAPDRFRVSDHDPVLVDLDLRYENLPRAVAAAATIASPTATAPNNRAVVGIAAATRAGGAATGLVTLASAGDRIAFSSSTVRYLVASSSGKAARLAGTGRLNGQAGYGYEVFLGDGTPDTVRFRITRNGAVVHDSGTRPVLAGTVVIRLV
jgi:uncharacterized protein